MKFPLTPVRGREFDVAGFGTNAVDFLIEVPEYPDFNSKVELIQYTSAAGGEIASTMAGLARLGMRVAYAGCFGDDDAGEFGMRSLELEGVDLSYSQRVAGASTQTAFIVIDARNGERTVIWKRDPKLGVPEDRAPLELASRASVLHISPHDLGAARALAAEARNSRTIVSIDIDAVNEGTEELLAHVDILIASSDFPARLLGIDDLRIALPEISLRFGCVIAGVTLGRKGSILYCDGKFIETPAFAVPGGCRDTTGAGDAFRVGIIYGLLQGQKIQESALLANAIASLKCRAVGARTALPRQNELEDLLTSAEKNL